MLFLFIVSLYRWFCGVDDDNYLNVKQLLLTLQDYRHEQDLYLGRASLSHPIEAMDRENKMVRRLHVTQFCHYGIVSIMGHVIC